MISRAEIMHHGFFTTIQDLGRFGFAKYGVPFSGAMDQTSYKFANVLLNNEENDACIEWTFIPPVLKFHAPTIIALTGAQTDYFLNEKPIAVNRQIKVSANDVFRGSFCKNKKYGYVGIKNGFLSEYRLNSRSFYNTITTSKVMQKGDMIGYISNSDFSNQFSSVSPMVLDEKCSSKLNVFPGPEFDWLTKHQKEFLINTNFTISGQANRMAIQLEEDLSNTLPSMLTSPVLPGTIQLTPSGKLIVLMRDCQTTGGYPRVLQLNQKAIDTIAQMRMNEKLSFKVV